MHDRLQFELVSTLTEQRFQPAPRPQAWRAYNRTGHGVRIWVGERLIQLGERLVPTQTEFHLEASTDPPLPLSNGPC